MMKFGCKLFCTTMQHAGWQDLAAGYFWHVRPLASSVHSCILGAATLAVPVQPQHAGQRGSAVQFRQGQGDASAKRSRLEW